MESLTRTFEYVDKWAAETPDAEAVVFEDRRISYAELAAAVDAAAKAFLEAGVERGDRVAMLAMGCPEFFISYMAANKVGASWLGLSPKFGAREISYIVGDCRPKVFITLRSYMDADLSAELSKVDFIGSGVSKMLVIGEPFAGAESFDAFIRTPRPHLDEALAARAAEVDPQDDALLMYTSGSTGQPKGVIQTHASILVNVEKQVKHFLMEGKPRSLLHFPINHVAADVEIGFATLYVGGTTVMMDRFDPAASLAIIGKEKITMLGQIPAMFLMQAGVPGFMETDFSSLQTIIWGGAAAPIELLRGLQMIGAVSGAKLMTGYGSTEACGFITYTKPDDDLEMLAKSVGYAAEGFEVRIVDNERKPVPAGTQGEVALRGPFLFKEYLNKPEATAEAMDSEGWYYTNDLGYLDENGALFLNGRKSEMYKTGGENVFPAEIEEVLCAHEAIVMAAVIGVPDPTFQEVGHAFVMLRPGRTVTAEELKAHCKENLANFKVPKEYDIRPMLPLLANGKVNKMELKKGVAAEG